MNRRDPEPSTDLEAPTPTPAAAAATPTGTMRMSPEALAGLFRRPSAPAPGPKNSAPSPESCPAPGPAPSTVETMVAAPSGLGQSAPVATDADAFSARDAADLPSQANGPRPSVIETIAPGARPSVIETIAPGARPSVIETIAPSARPSVIETIAPSARPSVIETIAPSARPVVGQTVDLDRPPAPVAADPNETVDGTICRPADPRPTREVVKSAPAPARPSDNPPLERNLALARLQSRMLGTPAAAVKVGRFIVIEKLGQGAMGIVYLAYDPKLDRRVALKLVDTSSLGSEVGDAHVRLEREAKASASLGHPNVVTVYDVGTQGEEVFLAMEYVEGGSLSGWMEEKHNWRDTLRTFVQIARGLAAAHQAGLVHRDFKPDNVLMGLDGRPRVADFGLARPTEGWNLRDAQRMLAAPQGRRPAGLGSADALASTGDICGTPAYMAPEQFSGVDVTPAADQFGFCASLFEALFGYRPFAGESVTELAIAVIENDRQKVPSRHSVPASVVRQVLRGLEPAPEKRHASMGALADRLESSLRARNRNLALGAASLVAVLGVGLGAQASNAMDEDPCDAAAHALDTTWSPQRRDAVATQLAGTDSAAAAAILPRLDAFAEAWTAQRVESCQATRIRGEQADTVLAFRMACLDRAQSRLDATVTALDEDPSDNLLQAVPEALGDVSACEDVEALRASWEGLSSDEHVSAQRRAGWLRAERLATSLVLRRSDPPATWRADAEEMTQLGEAHRIPQAAAEGHTFLGRAALTQGDLPAAGAEFEQAFDWAILGMHDTLPAVMLLQADVALRSNDLATAALLTKQARGFAQRVEDGPRRTRLIAEADLMGLQVEIEREHLESARERLSAMVEREDLRDVPRPDALRRRMTSMLGTACRGLGDLPCAARYHEESLALAQAQDDVEPLELAGRFANVGLIRADMGEGPAAIAHFETAAGIVEDAAGAKHPMRGQLLCDMGGITVALIDPSKGKAIIRDGLDILTSALGEEAPERVEPLIDLSRAALAMNDPDAARGFAEQATTAVDASRDPGHPHRADPRIQRGRVEEAAGDPVAAAAAFGEALALLGESAHPMQRAEVRFDRARALAASPSSREEAREEAQAALDGIADFPPGKPLGDAIVQWRTDALDGDPS